MLFKINLEGRFWIQFCSLDLCEDYHVQIHYSWLSFLRISLLASLFFGRNVIKVLKFQPFLTPWRFCVLGQLNVCAPNMTPHYDIQLLVHLCIHQVLPMESLLGSSLARTVQKHAHQIKLHLICHQVYFPFKFLERMENHLCSYSILSLQFLNFMK